MKFDTTCRQDFFIVLLLPIVFLAMRFFSYPLFGDLLVNSVEFAQAVWLLLCGLFTYGLYETLATQRLKAGVLVMGRTMVAGAVWPEQQLGT